MRCCYLHRLVFAGWMASAEWLVLRTHLSHVSARRESPLPAEPAERCPRCADFLISDEMIASKEETVRGTLRHLADKYGGARSYARAIGVSDAEVPQSSSDVFPACAIGAHCTLIEFAGRPRG